MGLNVNCQNLEVIPQLRLFWRYGKLQIIIIVRLCKSPHIRCLILCVANYWLQRYIIYIVKANFISYYLYLSASIATICISTLCFRVVISGNKPVKNYSYTLHISKHPSPTTMVYKCRALGIVWAAERAYLCTVKLIICSCYEKGISILGYGCFAGIGCLQQQRWCRR